MVMDLTGVFSRFYCWMDFCISEVHLLESMISDDLSVVSV